MEGKASAVTISVDDWTTAAITDQGIEDMRSRIGLETEARPWNRVVTEDSIWHFANGLGDDNPLWWDRAYAEANSIGRMWAPPTWLYSAGSGGPRPGEEHTGHVEELLPGAFGVWASDRWRWYQRVWEGTPVRSYGGLHAVEERRTSFGGRSVAQTERTQYFDDSNSTLIAECYRTIFRFERAAGRQTAKYADMGPASYSASDLQAIADQYDSEIDQRRGATTRYWDDVEAGESLGRMVKGPLTITNLVGWLLGWGSPLCQTNRIAHHYLREHPGAMLFDADRGITDTLEGAHWDPYFAQMSGLPNGYDFGCQRISWLGHLLTDWCGDDGFLSELDVQVRRPNLLGDTTWLRGTVTGKRITDDGAVVDCELVAENQRNQVTATGVASVVLPRK